MAAGPTQEELSENAELSVPGTSAQCPGLMSGWYEQSACRSSSGFLPGPPPPAEVFSPILDLVPAPMQIGGLGVILITGAAGTIGRPLVDVLVHEGAEVHAVIRGTGPVQRDHWRDS